MRIRKAVIPAAGLGTRFLPTTKSVPKELLPVLDKPLIQYAVEEAASAGIEQTIIVSSPDKPSLESYFQPDPRLESLLAETSPSLAEKVSQLPKLSQVSTVIQREPLGLGHAVLTAAGAVGDEPFLVMLPDDLIFGERSGTQQLLEVFERFQASVLAVEEVPPEAIGAYGVIDGTEVADGVYQLRGLVEKPPTEKAPSNLGIVGRYILTPRVFDCLRRTPPGAKDEIQLTDGVALLLKEEPVYARRLSGVRHDGGTPMGLLKVSLAVALRREDARKELVEFLAPFFPSKKP